MKSNSYFENEFSVFTHILSGDTVNFHPGLRLMPSQLFHYLVDTYECRHTLPHSGASGNLYPIQIDDQDDNDNINEFCNVFCTVLNNKKFRIDLTGSFPLTDSITDLADIYNGFIDRSINRLSMVLYIKQIDVVADLADKIKKATFITDDNASSKLIPISARTISTLYRFVRTVKEFSDLTSSKRKK